MPNIMPVSDLRNYNTVLQKVSAGTPVYMTKNGRGVYAIMEIGDLEEYEEAMTLLRMKKEMSKNK